VLLFATYRLLSGDGNVVYGYRMLALPEFRFPTPRDIERLAFEAGVSIGVLCDRAGVSSQAFRNWKFGRVSPTLSTVQKLTEAGLALVTEAQGASTTPSRSGRKVAAKPRAAAKGTTRTAKPAASKRPAGRRA
jgi:hypothetical protein